MWSEGRTVWRRIDSEYFEAQVVTLGDVADSGTVSKIRYVDGKFEENVPTDELTDRNPGSGYSEVAFEYPHCSPTTSFPCYCSLVSVSLRYLLKLTSPFDS